MRTVPVRARRRVALVLTVAVVVAPAATGRAGTGVRPPVDTWVERFPAQAPSARSGPALAYDAARRQVVLFGGNTLSGAAVDTWVWDGTTWAARNPVHPSACDVPVAAYDTARRVVVLFCGGQATTWTWDGVKWTQAPTLVHPSARYGTTLAYDAARGETVLFGGTVSGSAAADTWVWTGSAWVQRLPATSPPARSGAAMTYDAGSEKVVLFGGGGGLADTWTWDGLTWTDAQPADHPPARYDAAFGYDESPGRAVLFGGAGAAGALSDTWTWDGATWIERGTADAPSPRFGARAAYDAEREQLVLFGGEGADPGPVAELGVTAANDTWTYGHAADAGEVPCFTPPTDAAASALPGDAAPVAPTVESTVSCCDDPPTDATGNVVLPAGATDVRTEDVDVDTGRTVDLYPTEPTARDDWYRDRTACPWSIGGDVPPMDGYTDLDAQFRAAGLPYSTAEMTAAVDRVTEDLPLQVSRPTPDQMLSQGRIDYFCPFDPHVFANGGCSDRRALDPSLPFGGRDIIYVHGLEPDTIAAKINGVPGADATWPADPAAFEDGGFWKQRADAYWSAHITKYLKNGAAGAPPSNRYLTVAWASTQWLPFGVHAMLSQVARAMATGAGVVLDASGSRDGFCAQGCVIVSHSTGGLLADVAMAVAMGTLVPPLSALGDLWWVPSRIVAHVAYASAYSGSHYATLAAALGWFGTLAAPACALARWELDLVFGISLPCAQAPIIAESVLTDLAVPITQLLWRPLAALSPVPTLLVTDAHPTSIGADGSSAKTWSPLIKMLVHHGLDDGVLSMDSQCATRGDWREAPQSFVARPTFYDAIINGALVGNSLPPVVVARAYDMGQPIGRATMYYVDQVLGAQLLTPQFWKALFNGGLSAHFASSAYRVSGTCVPYLSPTGMVEPLLNPEHPDSASPERLPGHYALFQSASDHLSGAVGPFDTGCYEATFGSGFGCGGSDANNEEVRTIDNPAVYAYVSPGLATQVQETVKGRRISFRLGFVRFRWWVWKRTYHRLSGWQSSTVSDYVYRYALRP